MKRFVLGVALALGVSAPAQAAVRPIAPPGNSGINQYLESIPTAHGNQPTNSLHSHGGGGGSTGAGGGIGSGGGTSGGGGGGTGSGAATGSGGGGSGSGAGSGSGSGGGSGSPVSGSTQRALRARGADGKAAAALAAITAPSVARRHRNAASGSTRVNPATGGSSALDSLAGALTGSASGGGLGGLLPVILVVALFGSAVMAILRRRGRA